MASHRGGLIGDLRSSFSDFAFRAKLLAAPLLQPFGPASEPSALDDGELDKLKSRLKRIRATLRAAEERVVADDFVRLWLRELEDLERMAEDVLEELEFEALRASRLEQFKRQLLGSSAGKRKREVSLLFSSSPDRLNRKIGKIMERYNELARDRDALRLRSSDGERRQVVSALTPTSCLMKCRLHGRERDKRQVIKLLLSDEANCCDVYSVVPIVGPAGVGKTTLVQHIYNDKNVSSEFGIKMWVWVCQEFDVLKLTRKLAEEATESVCGFAGMNQLHSIITNRLKGKRFLLVLDDVWDENQVRWASLQVPLKYAAPGSRIVVTTRSTKVAQMMASKIHRLGYLSDTNCWSVCQDAALQGRDPSIIDDNLMSIGKSVSAKCKGLPLAANAVGSALSIAIDRNNWEAVEQSYLWANSEVNYYTRPALLNICSEKTRWSGYGWHKALLLQMKDVMLKTLLASTLMALWRGFFFRDHHLVTITRKGNKSARTESVRYSTTGYCSLAVATVPAALFMRLLMRLAPSSVTVRYVMHDLYHELAEYVSAKEYSRIEKFTLCNVDEDARHLSLAPTEAHSNETVQFHASHNQYLKESHYPGLRTLLVVQRTEHKDEGNMLRINLPSGLFKHFVSLRALDLSNTDMEGLPHSIGELIHLRYLSLENTKIKCLPESISALFKLHTMNLRCCNYLGELPEGIKFLTNLRHLELPYMDNYNVYMPCGIGELTNLQTMHMVKVGNDLGSCGIADLVNLDKLRGELRISGIENVTRAQITAEASIKNKGELRKLVLHWSCIDSMFVDEASSVLDSLQPHPDLEELIIRGFSGARLPVWLGNQYMFNLSYLELKACQNCNELPPLGRLPCLKHLLIHSLPSVKLVGRMFSSYDDTSCSDCGSSTSRAFATLETLKFTNMESWEQWDNIEATDFPCLQHLTIVGCSKLRGLPKIEALQNLRIKNCEHLLDLPSFPSLQCIKMEGFCSVNHLLQLPLFSHLETLELRCHKRCHKKLVSVKRLQNSDPLHRKGPLHKISWLGVLPFQNLSVQDSQKIWTFLRCARRILECSCSVVACTGITFTQTNVQPSEGQPEGVELVRCKPVWVQIGQPEEIELVCID